MIDPKTFLKQEGFIFDKPPEKLDRQFLRSMPAQKRPEVEGVWGALRDGQVPETALYRLPDTPRQAHTLLSHDRNRYVKTFRWLEQCIDSLSPETIIEMGAGTGLLLRYLLKRNPSLHVRGLECLSNLSNISHKRGSTYVETADYLNTLGDHGESDVVICNFGFDISDLQQPQPPHSVDVIGETKFCPQCMGHFRAEFGRYMRAWRCNATPTGSLLLTGRLSDMAMLRGLVLAAADVGWYLETAHTRMLDVINLFRDRERFPALAFRAADEVVQPMDFEVLERLYRLGQ